MSLFPCGHWMTRGNQPLGRLDPSGRRNPTGGLGGFALPGGGSRVPVGLRGGAGGRPVILVPGAEGRNGVGVGVREVRGRTGVVGPRTPEGDSGRVGLVGSPAGATISWMSLTVIIALSGTAVLSVVVSVAIVWLVAGALSVSVAL